MNNKWIYLGPILCIIGCSMMWLFALIKTSEPTWEIRYEPTTPQEQQAVQQVMVDLMAKSPRNAADTFFKSYMEQIEETAKRTACRPTAWEKKSGKYTGKVKHVIYEAVGNPEE